MKNIVGLLLITLAATVVFAENVAVITKARGDVLLRKADTPNYSQSVTVGTPIEKYDQIKVSDGFAIMLLLDNQSQFKLRENTEVAITMVENPNGTDYRVRLDYGQALTKFQTVPGTGFYITTPTSVVSVKGTSFWTVTHPEAGDNVIVLDGVVEVMNLQSRVTSTASEGQTIRSLPDGTIQSAPTVPGTIPKDPGISEGTDGTRSKLGLAMYISLFTVILLASYFHYGTL